MSRPGRVYLIGAGPGDPGLLTRRGAELLGRAGVVVYDFLASPRLLELAKPGAELIYVGKRAGAHALPQEEINRLLVAKAQAGLEVARLKGGDPFIFGRGGEEAQALVEAGLEFEVVPGVSSALAAPACAGIPLTHRAHNAVVTLATGHEDPTKADSKLNWPALARTGGTLVFLMGMKKLAANARALIEGGLEPETPAAVIEWGATPRQRTLVSSLARVADEVKAAGLGAPAVLVVGSVVGLRSELAWLEKRPLWGLRVLVTRAREGASALAGRLEELGAEPFTFPTIALVEPEDPGPLLAALARLSEFDWLIFTSANGVDFFFRYLTRSGRDVRALGGLKLCAIGPGTARALEDRGFRPDLVPAEYRAEAVVEALAGEAGRGASFLLARAAEAREVLPQELSARGGRVEVVEAYRSVLPAAADGEDLVGRLDRGEIDLVIFTASSTVRNLARILSPRPLAQVLAGVKVAVIGPITAQTARQEGLEVAVQPEEYTLDGLIEALMQWRGGAAPKGSEG